MTYTILVQREHFFKDIISTATQTCLSKLCLQWIVQFLVKENHYKYIDYLFVFSTVMNMYEICIRVKSPVYY